MNAYSYLSNNELLELMDDYGDAHEIIHEAARRIRELMATVVKLRRDRVGLTQRKGGKRDDKDTNSN